MPTPVGAAPPPPGVTPVFNGPLNDKQKQIILTSAIMMALSTLFMGLRLFTRAFIVKSIGTDDCKFRNTHAEILLIRVLYH